MESEHSKPLLVIVGPTASGKSDLAMRIAREFNGEIICADSRTVYKGMDIGTAKPSQKDQQEIPHHLLDVVEPGESFSAFNFKTLAEKEIQQIWRRGALPILVGGTGLYVDSVILDYQFPSPVNLQKRQELEVMSLEELHKHSIKNNIELPENKSNKRYVVRNIERNNGTVGRRGRPTNNTIVVGIATKKEILKQRITQRTEHLFESGVVEEAKRLGEMYGWDSEAMTANIYRLMREYTEGALSLAEVKAQFTTLDWRLAKRQMTWFKRRDFIQWSTTDDLYLRIVDHIKLANSEQK